MERLFTILTITAVLMILLSGVGVYLTSQYMIATSKDEAAMASAKGAANALANQIEVLDRNLDKVAQDPDVIAAFLNPAELGSKAAEIEKFFPEARKIRLLPIGTIERDQTSVPRMGFGDVDMVKATFQDTPFPAIQGDEGQDRHLAMTKRVMNNNQAVGVILASLNHEFIADSMRNALADNGYLELKQDKLTLAKTGVNDHTDDSAIKMKVPGTNWEILYREGGSSGIGQTASLLFFILFPPMILLGTIFICYRQLVLTLAQDQEWVLQAFRDVLVNRPKGSYPVTLKGMNTVIASMVRFNREVELKNNNPDRKDDDFELEGFFDDINTPTAKLSAPKTQSSKSLLEDILIEEIIHTPKAPPSAPEPEPVSAPEAEVAAATASTPKLPKEIAAIFRAYDIRGIVESSLTWEMAYDIGRAFGSEARESGNQTIVVGMDGRNSSAMLADELIRGLVSAGCRVLNIGMVPTPVLYFVVQHTDGRSGVMVTGSHNPPEYNGFKMVMKGETLAGLRIQQIRERIEAKNFLTGEGSTEQNGMFESEYIGTLCEDIQLSRPLKIIVDCGNGAAGNLAPILFKTLGCEVIELFCEVNGNFPNHHPDPSKPDNLKDLIALVQSNHADLGIAFDGDGDRLGVIDSNGKIIWPDRQMMLFAKDVLAGKPGSEIIYDVKCSRHLADQIVKFGGRPLMWKTGHSFMKAKLKETGAKLAGEMSGHIFFNDRWFGFDDALYAAARLLQILSETSKSSAEIFHDFPESLSTPELNVELAEGENVAFVERMFALSKMAGGKVTDIDGMRIDFSEGWGLVRASNTTPSLVVRFEAQNQAAMDTIQGQFRKLMLEVKPGLKLPF